MDVHGVLLPRLLLLLADIVEKTVTSGSDTPEGIAEAMNLLSRWGKDTREGCRPDNDGNEHQAVAAVDSSARPQTVSTEPRGLQTSQARRQKAMLRLSPEYVDIGLKA